MASSSWPPPAPVDPGATDAAAILLDDPIVELVWNYWFGNRYLPEAVRAAIAGATAHSSSNAAPAHQEGHGRVNPYSPDYLFNSKLWFRASPVIDEEIKAAFEPLVKQAGEGHFDWWLQGTEGGSGPKARSVLAYVILLDQFPRHIYRGSGQAFAYDGLAIKAAKLALSQRLEMDLSPPEHFFLYLALMHSELLEDAELALEGVKTLQQFSTSRQSKTVKSWLHGTERHLEQLRTFGRYPHRNQALGRENTPEEEVFLQAPGRKPLFMRSQMAGQSVNEDDERNNNNNNNNNNIDGDGKNDTATLQPKKAKNKTKRPPTVNLRLVEPRARKLKILMLHGFRQNGKVFRQRTKKLANRLSSIAELHYVTSPVHYQPQGDTLSATLAAFGSIPDYPMQQVWWLSSEGNVEYEGLDISLSFLDQVFARDGPFDGVLGFAQGGTLAAIMAATQPRGNIAFDFFIPISAFVPRAHSLQHLNVPASIRTPALHILGAKDILVVPERSRALFELSDPANAQKIEHEFGHFVPGYWPLPRIEQFCQPFYDALPPPTTTACEADQLLQLEQADLLDRLQSLSVDEVTTALDGMHQASQWQSIQQVANAAFALQTSTPEFAANTAIIHDKVVSIYVHRLQQDLLILKRLHEQRNSQTDLTFYRFLTHFHWYAEVPTPTESWPSNLVQFFPRFRTLPDRQYRIAKRVAEQLFPQAELISFLNAKLHERNQEQEPEDTPENRAKLLCYKLTKQSLQRIKRLHEETSPKYATEMTRKLIESRSDPTNWDKLLQLPLSEYITRPRPEPVVPCSIEDLQPLLGFLKEGHAVEQQTAFAKGTLTVDGRLDLCKQVVGPGGIEPLLEAMMATHQVKRLLLGNNIVGDGGAAAIAKFIRERKDSPLDCWYIAGNEIGPIGFQHVCEALHHDTKVTSLWLKRNPLTPAGMPHLATLLNINRTIVVVDLVNCGLLDEGVAALLPALMDNTVVEHLYLGTNGITDRSAPLIAELLDRNRTLHSFYVSCNRIGDEGSQIIAPAIERNPTIRRLSFASNRIGPKGAAALLGALRFHQSVELFDLGYTKATAAVCEMGNFLGDLGAFYVAEMLKSNTVLRVLDLLHNGISQIGVNYILSALRQNNKIIWLQLTQFGKVHNEPGKEELKHLLQRNMAALSPEERDEVLKIETPNHIAEIYSVYRTHV